MKEKWVRHMGGGNIMFTRQCMEYFIRCFLLRDDYDEIFSAVVKQV
jgi:hypothetical protein